MSENREPTCPECDAIDRREFVRYLGAGALAAASVPLVAGKTRAAGELAPMPRLFTPNYAAENLVKELYAGMSDEQKKQVCRKFDDTARRSVNPNRFLDVPLGKVFTKTQQELIDRIVQAIGAGDDLAYRQLSRGGTWDASKSFDNCGTNIFGEPGNGKFAFLFTGHHLTIRCDGDSEEGAAFGGPIYYGHSPNGYNPNNVFSYQTREVMKLYDALDEKQKQKGQAQLGDHKKAEGAPSIQLPKAEPMVGIAYADLSNDQKELVAKVMRNLLSPFRKEDGDEVMAIIKESGGMEKIHLAFYAEDYENTKVNERQPWSFWRLIGPGFIWNFRVLPHVHTYVNISSRIG
jgi:hypothetical protein